MRDVVVVVLVVAVALAVTLGITLAVRIAINKFLAIDAISKLTAWFNAGLDTATDAIGEILAWLILISFRVGGFLLILYGLVRFVKWAWAG